MTDEASNNPNLPKDILLADILDNVVGLIATIIIGIVGIYVIIVLIQALFFSH